jgi:hypothetical protein
MKRSNRSLGLLIATLLSVTAATFGQVTFAATAGDAEGSKGKPTDAAVTHGAPLPSEMQPAINSSPLMLFIEAPTGDVFRLTYHADNGWQFADRAVGPKPTEAALTPTATTRVEDSSTVDEPLTVFIDGPTGFTYVWMRDAGWKFVGRVADRKR